jgi:CO/xanthine dehydrogenase FAD-binding subunit
MGSYRRPTELNDALAALAAGRHEVLAGGTDFYPARVGRAIDDDILDISAIAALGGIDRRADGGVSIGARATWSDVVAAPLPPAFDGLKQAAREIGGRQIQNAGTVVGNVCNASPAADGIPCLLALDAAIVLRALGGERRVALADFVHGNRATARRPDELVTAIAIPPPPAGAASLFLKLGARRYLVISIAMAAFVLAPDRRGRVAAASVAVGACSPVARRLPALEAALLGRPCDAALGDVARPDHLAPLTPIDDVRGTAAYRADAAFTLVRRGLAALGGALARRP